MTEPSRYLIECAAWLKLVTAHISYQVEIHMTAEADAVRESLVVIEANLSALIADLTKVRQEHAAMTVNQANAEANAAALADAKAKLDELNNMIIGASQ